MDRTQTPFGSRLLGSWLARPLTDATLITQRLDAVQALLGGADNGLFCLRGGVCVCVRGGGGGVDSGGYGGSIGSGLW